MVTAEELLRLNIQNSNILERVSKGSLKPEEVRREYQRIFEGNLLSDDPFDYLKPHLLTLEEQLDYIRHHNTRTWGNFLPDSMLEKAKRLTESDHEQTITDLEVLHVEGMWPGQTIDLLWTAIEATHPNSWRADTLQTDKIRLYEPQQADDGRTGKFVPVTNRYSAGVHKVRLNLLANWFPSDFDKVSAEEVRHNARTQGRVLAHGEVLSAMAWMSGLVPRNDGEKFPWLDLAGYELVSQQGSEIIGFWRDGIDRFVKLGSYGATTYMDTAAPEVLESRS